MKKENVPNDGSIKNISRRSFLKVTGVMGASAVLVACGAKPTSLPDATPLTNVGDAPAIITSKKLKYWSWAKSTDDNPRAKAQGMILDAFRKSHPNIEVEEELVSWDQLRQQLIQASAAGTSPDVSRQVDQYVGVLAESGAILPLDEFISTWSDDRKNDYLYTWGDTVIDGKKYAFRQSLRPSNLLYYRTDLFSKAPKTRDEFHEQIVSATSDQMAGYILPFSKADSIAQIMQHAVPLLWSLGGDFIDPATSKPTFHEDAGVTVFQWLQDLVYVDKAMPSGVLTMNAEGADNQFLGGVAASIFQNTAKWGQWSERDAIKGKIDTCPPPNFSNDSSKPGSANLAGAWTLTMGKNAQKEEAWKLIEFFQSAEAELIDAQVGGEIPTRKTTLNNDWFESDESARLRGYMDWMESNPHESTTLKIKNIGDFTDILGDALQEIMGNQADVKATLTNAADKYSATL